MAAARMVVVSGMPPSCGGGAESWIRVVSEEKVTVNVVSARRCGGRVPVDAVEHAVGPMMTVADRLLLERLVDESELVVLNDVCLIPGSLVDEVMERARRLGKRILMVVHEGEAEQCVTWRRAAEVADRLGLTACTSGGLCRPRIVVRASY